MDSRGQPKGNAAFSKATVGFHNPAWTGGSDQTLGWIPYGPLDRSGPLYRPAKSGAGNGAEHRWSYIDVTGWPVSGVGRVEPYWLGRKLAAGPWNMPAVAAGRWY